MEKLFMFDVKSTENYNTCWQMDVVHAWCTKLPSVLIRQSLGVNCVYIYQLWWIFLLCYLF